MNRKRVIPVETVSLESIESIAKSHLHSLDVEASLYIGLKMGSKARLMNKVSHLGQLTDKELVSQLWREKDTLANYPSIDRLMTEEKLYVVNIEHENYADWQECIEDTGANKFKVNILGLGDVGSTMALAMCLYGKGVISEIGIFDLSEERQQRWEMELNQIAEPLLDDLPKVRVIGNEELFDCDLFAFTASVGVPPLTVKSGDVRAVQFEGNSKLVEKFVRQAIDCQYKGIFAVVSDPVDQLCRYAFESGVSYAHEKALKPLCPEQIKGYGLGVMNGRANYYANEVGISYQPYGRVYGPHGQGLVVANDYRASSYDQQISEILTEKTITANLAMRALGHKPYVAPAVASGAIAITKTLKGDWHYSCVSFDGFYYGCLNKVVEGNVEIETLQLASPLKRKIEASVNAQEAQWQSFW